MTRSTALDAPGMSCPKRVLLCDDERHIVRLIRVNLERQACLVSATFGGEEAIRQLEAVERGEHPGFDLAVIDAEMPRIDGYAVLRWIRDHETTKEMPVVLLGGVDGGHDDGDGPASGVSTRYMAKPFDPRALL